MRDVISGSTRLAAVIGDPARHSLSPALHNAAFEALDLDWVYLAFDVERGRAAEALDAMRTLGIDGLSVTMPHKTDVARSVDELAPSAASLDAVNCVVRDGRRLVGHNTDGAGFVRGLRHDTALDPEGVRAVVLGAGGAARAVVQALAAAGAAEVVVVNRSRERAEVAAQQAGPAGRAGDTPDVAKAELVVNATPVGMRGADEGRLPCPPELLRDGQVVVDLIYDPLDTPWLVEARRRGARTSNGVPMLAFQAAEAFELWTGHAAPVEAMRSAVDAALQSRAKR